MDSYTQDFIKALKNPSAEYGEVPFYWWTGEKLNKHRLTSQLEALAANGVAGVQVNYAHMNKGGEFNEQYSSHGKTIHCDPEPFSGEWWDFFCHAAKECERLGMGIGVGDYTLAWIGNGFFTDEIAADEQMQAQELSCEKKATLNGFEPGGDVLAVVYYEDANGSKPVFIYDGNAFTGNELAEGKTAYIIRLKKVPLSINPMHPLVGKRLVDIYFKEFERRLPDLKPGTLNYFFQDELSFGCDEKLIWDENLRNGVRERYGYDPLGFIPHLFYELGDITPKIRLNIADIKTGLMEAGYFKPIFDFHAARGMIYGCDQSSRGKDPTEFTDYFRTVRWFTAPGNDTPGRASDLIKVKVNSSIAHLYRRPRTWLEGYHSSGWGTTLESITDATGDNFIFGANLLNLHGLYYSTNGGFFEWAPPDFHFRMPYWDDEKHWLKKYTRLSQLLTTGHHRCDVALYYPTASCTVSEESAKKATQGTFATAEFLFSRGLDFDFIDTQSLERAVCENAILKVSGEKYKVLVFSYNDAVNYSVTDVIKRFLDCGGVVAFVGCAPAVSDRAGANDSVFNDDIELILSHGNCSIAANDEALLSFINRKITRTFLPDSFDTRKIYSMCRVNGKDRLYYLRYASKDCVCRFEAMGSAYLFDIYNGKIFRLTGTLSLDGLTIIKIPPDLPDDVLILFTDSDVPFDGTINTSSFISDEVTDTIVPDDCWNFSVIPVLDNTYGDFYKPAGGKIGLQARFFDCAKAVDENYIPKKYTYNSLAYGHTMGIRQIIADSNANDLAAAISKLESISTDIISFRDRQYAITVPEVHDRYGIISTDETASIFEQGYHGLKGKVYDDNFAFTQDSVFIASVFSTGKKQLFFRLTGQFPDSLYLNGVKITDTDKAVEINEGENRIVASFTVKEDTDIYRNRAKLKRAGIYLTKENPSQTAEELCKCDFANDDYMHYGDGGMYVFRFRTAPGFNIMTLNVFGELISAYNDDVPMSVLPMGKGNFGGNRYEVRTGNINREISEVRMYIKADEGYACTGVIPEPVDLFCTEGVISAGDLSRTDSALSCFSGKFVYTNAFTADKTKGTKYVLNVEDAGATLKVEVNGHEAAVLTYAPFTCDITPFVQSGENELKLTVSNTLCNHYSTVPSRYSNYPQDAKSGLIGKVVITVY